jgi:hypothetical protein
MFEQLLTLQLHSAAWMMSDFLALQDATSKEFRESGTWQRCFLQHAKTMSSLQIHASADTMPDVR